MTIYVNTCRFCKQMTAERMVKYGTRHYAHFDCYLDAGKKLEALTSHQLLQFPYRVLEERGLIQTVADIYAAKTAA